VSTSNGACLTSRVSLREVRPFFWMSDTNQVLGSRSVCAENKSKQMTTKGTKYHQRVLLHGFLRVTSCPSWLGFRKLTHYQSLILLDKDMLGNPTYPRECSPTKQFLIINYPRL
jgi:hypothetical protein